MLAESSVCTHMPESLSVSGKIQSIEDDRSRVTLASVSEFKLLRFAQLTACGR